LAFSVSGKTPPKTRLTLSFVRHVTAPGKYYGPNGLILVVSPGGSKRWLQRLTVNGRRRDIGLGSAHTMTPSAAAAMAAKNKLAVQMGANPLVGTPEAQGPARPTRRVLTFAGFVLNRYRSRLAGKVGIKVAKDEYRLIKDTATPKLGRRPMAEITTSEILEVLDALRASSTATAKALRARLITIFDAAVLDGVRRDNPAKVPETFVLAAPKRITIEGDTRNKRILKELPAFLVNIEASDRRPSLLRLIRFNLATLEPPKACRLATWEQIDMRTCVWTYPQMQNEGADLVHFALRDVHMEILNDAFRVGLGDGTGWVFYHPQQIGSPYSENAAYKAMRDLGVDFAILDFRRVFEYWINRQARRPDDPVAAWNAHLRQLAARHVKDQARRSELDEDPHSPEFDP
jgi:hypothetical protein